MTGEKDMIDSLSMAAQDTLSIRSAMTPVNLGIRGKSSFGHLPKEDFYLQREFGTPKH
jgi:hypothetical protein